MRSGDAFHAALSCLVCIVAGGGCATMHTVTLVREGASNARIVYPARRKDELGATARELQAALQQACGAVLPLRTASPGRPPEAPAVVLGTAGDFPDLAAEFGLARLGPEGIAVCSTRGCVWLLGNTPAAVNHAAYTFLEHLGFRWYFPDPVWTVTPGVPNLSVNVWTVSEPAFAWRRIWYGWGPRTPKLRKDYDAWMRHNRQGGSFRVDCGHAWARYIPPRLFKEHPEWFAFVKGKRRPPQLCVSNPEVQQRFVEGVLALLRKRPDRIMASVEPNDGGGHCECPHCKAIGHGTVSDQVFFLANLAARAVRKEFPGKYVGLYAYAYHANPPHFPLEPNVYVQVTTGFRYTKLSFAEQVRAFRDLGARVGVYDYFSVYPWDWDLPGAAKAGRVHQLAAAIRRYHDLGLSTYTAESSCNWGPNGPGYWIAAHLMWNPDLDSETLMNDFCTNAFKKAAGPMRRLYERWSRGERFSSRTLKLALLDLDAAHRAESAPAVVARLDRVAMYLHWLRLWLDYDQSSRHNQWNRLVVAPPEEIVERAHRCAVFARRIMDTGLIHVWPMLYTSWFDRRFGALKRIDGFDLAAKRKAWTTERTDIPGRDEVAALFRDDLRHFASLTAVEISGRTWKGPLRPAVAVAPAAVSAWKTDKRFLPAIESAEILFLGRAGEDLSISWQPFDKGHTIDCAWSVRFDGAEVASGRVKAPKGQAAEARMHLPADGVYTLHPGTAFWRAARVDLGRRPLVFRAERADMPGRPKRTPLRFWWPPMGHPLYFYVPEGTRHFVVGIVSGGDPWTRLRIRTADGHVVVDDKVLAGSEISVIVEKDRCEYGAASAMANHSILPAAERSVVVPDGRDGQIWSLEVSGLRCVVELYDVPPYLACHPRELLIPQDAVAVSAAKASSSGAARAARRRGRER